MKAAEIESVMKFEATTTKIDGRGFCFKLANNWTLTVGPDVWWITDNQTLMMDTYESILSKKNMRIMYDKFKKNVKNKQGHLIRLHMSIIRQTNGKTTTTIDLFMNRSCQPSFGLIEAKYIQDKGESATSTLSTYGADGTQQKHTDLGDKAQWAVIKIMIRRLCENSMI
jgi:hypothetical protein